MTRTTWFRSASMPTLASALFIGLATPLHAQNATGAWSAKDILAKETYVRPPAEIEKLVTAPRQGNVSLANPSPDRKWFLKLQSEGLPTVQTFGKPHYYFGGLQVDFKANRARALTTRGASGLAIIDATSGQSRTIEVPKGASVSSPQWAPDGSRIAYIANFDDATRLYVADVATGKSKPSGPGLLLATLVSSIEWTADGKSIVAVMIPDGRAAPPARPEVETGPLVRMTSGAKNKTRTYASLLRDPFEKDLLEYYATGQLTVVDAKTGIARKVGPPSMIYAVDASPDGKYFRVTVMQKPFSYIVQYNAFGQSEQLWDETGRLVAELARRPLRETDGGDDPSANPADRANSDTVRRNFAWLPNGAGLSYLKQDPAPARTANDTSDAPRGPNGGGVRRKDHLYQWEAPFGPGAEKALIESDNRIAGVAFSNDANAIFLAENANNVGHVYATFMDEPGKKYTLWRLRGVNATVGARGGFGGGGAIGDPRGGNGDDSLTFYQNPGNLLLKRGRLGGQVVMMSSDGKYAYFEGTKYFRNWESEPPRGFVDKVEVRTAQKTRLFEGAGDTFESIATALDDDFSKAIVVRESPTTVPDSYLRDMTSGTTTKLTANVDPSPEFTSALRKLVWVTRADGIKFLVNLTLPADYREGSRLPAMFWLYPYEYTDQAGYDRTLRAENVNRFPQANPRTIEFLALQGYAVANFSPPVVGAAGRMNDNYISDLQRNLIAVIDELDRLGYIDRQRLGIGGHSYGAFTTLNALTHTPYFKAGIAGDGMYNRSLTPNGFQNERRDFWEGQQTYLEMSPFLEADKLQGALLMYHSIEDQNVGTDPISSVRMMHALQSLGKTASLYLYPYEDHGPATRETILDQWARWTAWLDIYVKNANKPKVAS